MTVNDWINENYKTIEEAAKSVLRDRYKEGISEFYIHLVDKGEIPKTKWYINWFMKNCSRPNGVLNYQPLTLKGDIDGIEIADCGKEMERLDLMLDLDDELLVDFILNNHNNQKWIKIYDLVYNKGIKLDIFEEILFEYVFVEGMSIRKIVKITGNSKTSIYQMRKSLIDRIKKELI